MDFKRVKRDGTAREEMSSRSRRNPTVYTYKSSNAPSKKGTVLQSPLYPSRYIISLV